MKSKYDVVIIGAGPIGTYTAYQLADKGHNVCLIDKKKTVGEDVICSGVISKAAFKRYDLPSNSIISRIDSVTFFSPTGKRLDYEPRETFAYVVDRKIFDKSLFRLAQKFGVTTCLKHKVIDIKKANGYYIVKYSKKQCKTKAVVIATGVDNELQTKVGLSKPRKFLYGSQTELPISFSKSNIQIHIGQEFAPGSFGWVVPAGNNTSRIGLIVHRRGKKWLKKMLEQRLNISAKKLGNDDLKVKPIVFGPVKNSVKENVLTVGEAAGQIKTTTGGGIFYGLLCSEIAVDKLNKMLKNGNTLTEYELTWRSALTSELDIGMRLRSIAIRLSNADIENLFNFVKQNRFWVNLLVPRINFDFHSNVIFFCMKSFSNLLRMSVD